MFPERHALRFGVYAGAAAALGSRRRWPKVAAAAGCRRVRAPAGPQGVAPDAGARRTRRRCDRRPRDDGVHRLRQDGGVRGGVGRPRTPRRLTSGHRECLPNRHRGRLGSATCAEPRSSSSRSHSSRPASSRRAGSTAAARGDGTIRLNVMTFNIREGGRPRAVLEGGRGDHGSGRRRRGAPGAVRPDAEAGAGARLVRGAATAHDLAVPDPSARGELWLLGLAAGRPRQGRHDREHPQPVVSLHRRHDAIWARQRRPRSCRSSAMSGSGGCSRSSIRSRRSSPPETPCSSPATSTPRRGATGPPRVVNALGWQPTTLRYRAPRFSVRWPTSVVMEKAGFRDSFREVHPDAVTKPGFTWTSGHPGISPWDVFDRIDFVWAAGSSQTLSSRVIGDDDPMSDIVVEPWPSDHRAVVSTFERGAGRCADVRRAARRAGAHRAARARRVPCRPRTRTER